MPGRYYTKVFEKKGTAIRFVMIDTAPLIDKYRNIGFMPYFMAKWQLEVPVQYSAASFRRSMTLSCTSNEKRLRVPNSEKYSWCRLESATFSDSLQSMPSMSATFPKERFFISDTIESRGTS